MKRKTMQAAASEWKRTHVLELLGAGLILQTEAANLLGVTRQTVNWWVKQRRMHPSMARKRYLRELVRDRH